MPYRTRTFALCLRLGCAVAALAAAYACDARTPTAPAPALTPATLLRDEESDGTMLGSIDLAPASGSSTFATIPENKWALVRVSGKWIVKPNPACADQPPNWPCSSLQPYSGYDPNYPDAFAGPVRVKTGPLGSTDALELRGVGGQDEAVGLTQREFARVVEASPALTNPTVQAFGNTGPSVQSYIFEGSYTVTVTQIASPIRVTEGAAEADGSRTYTVEPLYGLEFINPLGSFDPPGAVRWFFSFGDSVDPVATNSDPPWQIDECRNLTTCRWQPPGPGRVQVSAFVETRRARARSVGPTQCTSVPGSLDFNSVRYSVSASNGCEQEPTLVLKCNGNKGTLSLVRGSEIRCSPETEPAGGAITITQWRFTGISGYAYPGPDDFPVTDAQWFGPIVMSGTVLVTAKVGTSESEQTASVAVTVTPRTTRPEQPDLFTIRQGTLDDIEVDRRPHVPPLNPHDLGMIQFRRATFGTDDPTLASTFLGFVADGPNTHLAYLTKVPARVDAVVAVNSEMAVGTDFYRRQAHSFEVATPTCVQEMWHRYIALILHHEGFPINEESHAGYYRNKFFEDAWPAVEDIVRPDNELNLMAGEWQRRMQAVFTAANTRSSKVDEDHPVPFNCTFKF